jgi:hypothetical protein
MLVNLRARDPPTNRLFGALGAILNAYDVLVNVDIDRIAERHKVFKR